MIRRLIILLLIVGCEDFAPTNHTHTDTGETFTDTLYVYDTLIVNYDTTIFVIDTVYIDSEDIYGCTIADACNFNSDATIFDNSCDYEDNDNDGICNSVDDCTVLDLEAECYLDGEGNNYGQGYLPPDFGMGSLESCPDDYYECTTEDDANTFVNSNFCIPMDIELVVLIRDNCSTIIDTTHSGHYAANCSDFSYNSTTLETGVYQQAFQIPIYDSFGEMLSSEEYTRNFYICNP